MMATVLSPDQLLADAGVVIEAPGFGGRLAPKRFDQCRADHAQDYILKGVLARGDLGLIFGQPGSGKSLLGPLLAHAIAEGREVFGRRTRKGRVLYIAAEAGADMEVRFVALRKRYGNVDGLHLIAASIDLLSPDSPDIGELLAVIRRLKPDVVIVDTIAAAFPGLEENEAGDMGRAVAALRSLSEPCGSAVVAIHHAPKEGNTPRGHSKLNGDADVTMRVEGEHDQVRSVTFGKNRNGPSGHAFDFGLELVDLGTDEDGDPISRPVALEVESTPTARNRKPLNDAQAGWLRDIQDLFAEPGTVPRTPKPGMPEIPTRTRDEIRVGLRGRGRFELDSHGNLTAKDRDRLRVALNTLKDKGKIGMTETLVWLL